MSNDLDNRFLPCGSETNLLRPTWLAGLRDAVKQEALPWKAHAEGASSHWQIGRRH